MLDYSKLCPEEAKIIAENHRLKQQNRNLRATIKVLKRTLIDATEENEQLKLTRVIVSSQN